MAWPDFFLANGALSGGGDEYEIRKKLIENRLVEAIIILPRTMFYTTDISVTLWVLNNNKKARTEDRNNETVKYRDRQDEILFMDLRQWGEPFEKKYTQFSKDHFVGIAKTFHSWQRKDLFDEYEDKPEFCYSAKIEEVIEKDFSLVPSKYIEFINRDENLDYDDKMSELQDEFADLLNKEEQSKKA